MTKLRNIYEVQGESKNICHYVNTTKNKFVFINCIHFYNVIGINKTMDYFICKSYLLHHYEINYYNNYFLFCTMNMMTKGFLLFTLYKKIIVKNFKIFGFLGIATTAAQTERLNTGLLKKYQCFSSSYINIIFK